MFSLQIILACVVLHQLPFNTKAQSITYYKCENSTTYAMGSTFDSNLKLLFSSLIQNTSQTGFCNDTIGSVPNRVYGSSLCCGDIKASDCSSCLTTASEDLPQLCPYSRDAIVWYEVCMLRYSNKQFFSDLDMNRYNLYNPQNWSDPYQFELAVVKMMSLISTNAVQSSRMFSTGVVNLTASDRIYGLVQCTMDLSGDQCLQCLNLSMQQLEKYLYGNVLGISLAASCILWYETEKFFSIDPFVVVPTPPHVNTPSVTSPPLEAPKAPEKQRKGKNKKRVPIALGIALPLVLSTAFAIFLLISIQRRKRSCNRINEKNILGNVKGGKSLPFEFSTLQKATEGFSHSNKLGEGGFGAVYKGKLLNGREIAVKRLSTGSHQGLKELLNEVQFLSELQHKNLVRLLGVCMEKKEMLLVYEYIQNKSLDALIFVVSFSDETSPRKLNWEERLKIIKGISKGLLYLHQDSPMQIVHRDLKAGNILLDENMNPKISDFGLARLLGGDRTQSKTSKVVGTYGYMAPEYAIHGTVSTKVDIFSFGVLILEIITGRSNSSFSSTSAGNLLNYAWEHWTNGAATELIDPCLSHEPNTNHEIVRCINIALLCVQERPNERPNIFSVNLMLTRKRMQIPPPSKPAFVLGETSVEDRDMELSSNSTSTSSVKYSINEVSCTEPYPR
ncbi:cysteine-rich RECEPTOR-like kinase [Rhynchospora pubera]|uniref:Cysteine-rich RECEPTOR-like kinase n=1 Tax=Rhynchospora pubera TaxID=906938 RepID=A0AAV8GBC6_9POAL|nr:cysteine-rich RECEPTOR-like kinase [Rhynchospora pubera]